jgi:hypothetical protein
MPDYVAAVCRDAIPVAQVRDKPRRGRYIRAVNHVGSSTYPSCSMPSDVQFTCQEPACQVMLASSTHCAIWPSEDRMT